MRVGNLQNITENPYDLMVLRICSHVEEVYPNPLPLAVLCRYFETKYAYTRQTQMCIVEAVKYGASIGVFKYEGSDKLSGYAVSLADTYLYGKMPLKALNQRENRTLLAGFVRADVLWSPYNFEMGNTGKEIRDIVRALTAANIPEHEVRFPVATIDTALASSVATPEAIEDFLNGHPCIGTIDGCKECHACRIQAHCYDRSSLNQNSLEGVLSLYKTCALSAGS